MQRNQLLPLKFIHIAIMVAVPVYLVIVFVLRRIDFKPVFDPSDPVLTYVIIAFCVVAFLSLLLGFYWFDPVKRLSDANRVEGRVLQLHIVRLAFIEAAAVEGLILWILGGGLAVVLPMILIPFLALVLIFPTQKRWKHWTGSDDDSPHTFD